MYAMYNRRVDLVSAEGRWKWAQTCCAWFLESIRRDTGSQGWVGALPFCRPRLQEWVQCEHGKLQGEMVISVCVVLVLPLADSGSLSGCTSTHASVFR